MKTKFKFFIGLFMFAFIVGLNVRHVLNDYGVKENKLHSQILAQSTTSGCNCGCSSCSCNSSGCSGGTTNPTPTCMSYVVDNFVVDGEGYMNLSCENSHDQSYCWTGTVYISDGEISSDYRVAYYCY